MRMKMLQAGGNGRFSVVYPSTLEQYRQTIDTARPPVRPGAVGARAPGSEGSGPEKPWYVVTTSVQRRRWGLPDFAGSGRVPVVDEGRALRLLDERAARPGDACRPFRDDVAEESPARPRQRGSEDAGSDKKKAWLRSKLPWRTSHPQWFDRDHAMRVLNRTHGALEAVKARIVEHLAASPQSSDLLTVEICCSCRGSNPDPRFALVVRSGSTAAARVLCLAGARGTGRMSLTVSIAEALGRAHVGMSLKGGDPSSMIFGDAAGPGRVIRSLARVQVKNPIFVLDALDAVDDDGAEPLLALLDPSLRTTFKDEFIDVTFDLSQVVWIATAVDRSAIPDVLRSYLEIVELPAYTEEEKLAVAEQHLLARPFDGSLPPPATALAPDSAAHPAGSGTDPAQPSVQPVVLIDRLISGPAELAAFSAEPPSGDGPVEAWRTAASSGAVRFELDAIRRVIRDYTGEAGVGDLNRVLAQVCREVVRRRPAGFEGPDVVTPVVVAEILGTAFVDSLPPAVREAVAAERRRLSDGSSDTSKETNSWIEWLLHLPWTRRNDRRIDLTAVRAALDAGTGGLERAKTSRHGVPGRTPAEPGRRRVGAVLPRPARGRQDVAGPGGRPGPSGGGSPRWRAADCATRRSCGGTTARGAPRSRAPSCASCGAWGYRDPVFVFDEIDKIGPDPAAVLLEVFDPEQQSRFRDAFVEIPFDLSEILFITTANDRECIPGAAPGPPRVHPSAGAIQRLTRSPSPTRT